MRKAMIITVLVLAVASGGAASIMTYRILKDRPIADVIPHLNTAPTFPLVVAAVRLPYGTALQAEHLKTVEWASPIRPEGSFTDPKVVIGRAIIEGVVPDEPILETRLAPINAGGGLASVIPVGKRAVSVRVNEIIGVAGFVLPRTRVDVLVSVNTGGEKGRSASRMILQNVEVLAAGQKIEQDERGKPETVNVITLLVTPQEAEKLTRAIIEGVVPDEPILETRLAPINAGGGLASVIPVGKRAVSVRVNEIIGVAGFVLPRTRVDVLVSVNTGGEKGRSASRMILQNVEVLAAGQKIEQDERGKPETVNVITLLVTPQEAEKLTLASNEGDLQLALRNSLDLDAVDTSGANLSAMVHEKKRAIGPVRPGQPAVPKPSNQVEVIRGNKRTTESFK